MSFIAENICSFKKIKTIIVFGKEKGRASEMILEVLRPRFKIKKLNESLSNSLAIIKNDIFIIVTDLASKDFFDKVLNFIRFSEQTIMVCASGSDSADNVEKMAELILAKPDDFLIFNFDDENSRKIGEGLKLKKYSFGFEQGADFRASDLHQNNGINFKINFQGKTIPVWQENFSDLPPTNFGRVSEAGFQVEKENSPKLVGGKESVYSSLCVSSVATILGMNFVEISEGLKRCKLGPDKVK